MLLSVPMVIVGVLLLVLAKRKGADAGSSEAPPHAMAKKAG